jgi:ADP-ribose pyrophosphatase
MGDRLIHREYLYLGRILDLSLNRYQSEAKGEVEIEIVHHTGGAAIVPFFNDGTVALVKQWRYPLNRYSLELPAGRIERGHSPEETAARELEEETGYRAGSLQKIADFYVAPGYCEERIHVFLARELKASKQRLDDDEEIEVIRLPISEAISLIGSGKIDDGKSIIGLLAAAHLIENR